MAGKATWKGVRDGKLTFQRFQRKEMYYQIKTGENAQHCNSFT